MDELKNLSLGDLTKMGKGIDATCGLGGLWIDDKMELGDRANKRYKRMRDTT